MTIDIFNLKGRMQFLGNSIPEWIAFVLAIILGFYINKLFFLFTFIWIENFFFWLIPILAFHYYHWEAYRRKPVEEYLEIRKLNSELRGSLYQEGKK